MMRLLGLIFFLALPVAAGAQAELDPLIGAQLDREARLTDAAGTEAALGDLLAPDGTLLVLGYHRCTNMCGILQRALAETLAEMPKAPRVLFASLDPQEGPADARAMQGELAAAVPEADLSDWHFLTGPAPALAALSKPMGMQTYVRPGGEVLVHPAATAVLTPEGALSEVFYALDFDAAELGQALDRAADGYVGGLRERIILLCSGFDGAVGRIARAAWASIRLAALATLLLGAGGVVLLLRRAGR